MRLIKPSYKILIQEPGLTGIYKQIELAGRTCYKSEDLIAEGSALPFVNRMVESSHFAILEHGAVYLDIPFNMLSRLKRPRLANKYLENPYCKCAAYNPIVDIGTETQFTISFAPTRLAVSTNYRVMVENGWLDDLKYLCEPTKYHVKRVTVHFVCNRQVSHEFVRHRVFSFAQESTRYCNYAKNKFGNELTFIQPCWDTECALSPSGYGNAFTNVLRIIEKTYLKLIQDGWKPQQAATILPNAIKTELVMTGWCDGDGWGHFFDLRAKGITGTPHPQASQLAIPLMHDFENLGLI